MSLANHEPAPQAFSPGLSIALPLGVWAEPLRTQSYIHPGREGVWSSRGTGLLSHDPNELDHWFPSLGGHCTGLSMVGSV